jgi:hypothetical protein
VFLHSNYLITGLQVAVYHLSGLFEKYITSNLIENVIRTNVFLSIEFGWKRNGSTLLGKAVKYNGNIRSKFDYICITGSGGGGGTRNIIYNLKQ